MKESIKLQGFKYADAPTCWELVPVDPPVTSLQLLLQKFYAEWRWHHKPLGWVRNPENKAGDLYYGPHADVIVVPCRCSFYFVLERQFNEIFGPHTMTLFYKSQYTDNELAWVAICQIHGLWHSDERMLASFLAALKSKELYQSEKTASIVVLK